jgi:hypothetical protein
MHSLIVIPTPLVSEASKRDQVDPCTSQLAVGTDDRRDAGALEEFASELSLGGGLGPGLRLDDVGGGDARRPHPR